MHAASERVHLRSLTGLRFFAALAVVAFHLVQQFESLAVLKSVTGFGYAGVSFFFILSGFVLAWSHPEGGSSREFYWRRFARVWPLHAVTTGLAVLVTFAVGGLPLNWPSFPLVATLTQAWSPDGGVHYGFNAVSWSLSAEAFFYLMFPAIFVGLCAKKNLWKYAAVAFVAMAVIGIAVMALMSRQWVDFLVYVLPAFRIGEFIIGICLALAFKRGWRPSFSLKQALIVTGGGYVALMAVTLLTVEMPAALPSFMANLWLLPGFVAVIAAATAGDLRGDQGFVRSAPIVKLGQRSFALYLIHELVIRMAAPSLGRAGVVPALITAVIVAAIAVGLSGALYEFVERPVEKRLRGMCARPAPSPQPDHAQADAAT